ncbi:MAG TPA: hypothetical protein VKB34_02625 [Povalibacter sp.]|nr:hypothetical protein [Povalibacter sp.]
MSANPEDAGSSSWLQCLHTYLSVATSDYNEVHKLARAMENRARQQQQRGLVIEAFRQMIVNRYTAIISMRQIYAKAREGIKWVGYFHFSPTLERDVRWSCMEYAKAMLAAPSLQGVMKAGATVMGTTSNDIRRVERASKQIVTRQVQILTLSTTTSVLISVLLKQVGTRAKSEYLRIAALRARGVWQVTGILALAYGFARICEAMEESGAAVLYLRNRRDVFIAGKKEDMKTWVSDVCGEGIERGWKL